MYRNRYMSRIGATLAGRDALAEYGLMSLDETYTWIESEYPRGVWGAFIFVDRSPRPEVIHGRKCSPANKALVDYMEFPYDDSALLEAFELLGPEEKEALDQYIIDHHKVALCKDSRWADCFTDIIQGHLADEIAAMKLNLKIAIENKVVKELLAFMRRLRWYYPDGIEKKELLQIAAQVDKDSIKNISIQDMENYYAQSKSFDFEYNMLNRSIHEYIAEHGRNTSISDFFSMLSGLTDKGIPTSFIFNKGYWQPRK